MTISAPGFAPWPSGFRWRTAADRSGCGAGKGGALADPPAAAAVDPDLFELRAFLDEELQRLPRRYREPLRLCELEGATRHDAARRLGIPEGTLSTRLARGRVMLRDRLTRRGVAVGALGAMFPAPARAGTLGALADASTRLALKFAARDAAAGTVPAAVASLAEGVLQMIQTARLKSVALATSTLIAVGLAAGLVAGRASPPAEPPAKVVAQAAGALKDEKPAEPIMARGVVVDEAGNPVAGAEVRVDPYSPIENLGVTDQNGAFGIPVNGSSLRLRAILVRGDDGRKLGVFHYDYNLSKPEGDGPVRIVMKPSREITVQVADANKAPIEGAVVEAVADRYAEAHAMTGADGTAKLSVPIDSEVSWIVAKKQGTGFDYAEVGKFDALERPRGATAAVDLPDTVALTLESPRVARIKAVDADGKPLAGIGFRVWRVQKEGRRSVVDYLGRPQVETTDADGIATFDWLPPSAGLLQFWPADGEYPQRRVIVEPGQTEPVVATMARKVAIRGRVVMPDGSPARGVQVAALGTGQGLDNGKGTARANADGNYEMSVAPNEAYAVYVDDKDWVAPSRLDVVIRPGKPVDGVDFQLARGTVIKGTITVGDGNRPAAGEYVRLVELGVSAFSRQVRRQQFSESTDAEGRYAIRVGPGTYTLMGPPRTEEETIEVADQPEIVRDFHMPRPTRGPLSGRVIAGLDGKPVAGARVEIVPLSQFAARSTIAADDDGRFQTVRFLDKSLLCGWSPDGSLGGFAEIGPEDPEVVITLSPTATATGLLLDEGGKPAAKQQLEWGRRVDMGDDRSISMTVFAITLSPTASATGLLLDEGSKPVAKQQLEWGRRVDMGDDRSISMTAFTFDKVVTDDQGRFTLPALVVGQKYEIGVKRENLFSRAGVAEPQKPGPLDLGTLQIGAVAPALERKAD